ncbi:lipopolysaccharide assembly LapA domain-containing protein [Geomicrobium sp. JCM 19039]|uniref:LapA family protein n=1 Tax=Geomicrobium sp. JCM 19039 TaxID=1460636 RepID=UPI00045F1E15|nr:lipopolysaccharide assembly protein LapA domain-containing protein [Geomicrobium sp. JCM 19039]GAK11318.1 hypothetical protein JCM19039_1004 [Geomicrobium sp. JCM 19039]
MKGQWTLILGLIAALLISIFAVINVDSVTVDFMFATTQVPLILIILGSVLMGGVIVGAVGMLKVYKLQQEIRRLKKSQQEGRQVSDHPDPKDQTSEIEHSDTD